MLLLFCVLSAPFVVLFLAFFFRCRRCSLQMSTGVYSNVAHFYVLDFITVCCSLFSPSVFFFLLHILAQIPCLSALYFFQVFGGVFLFVVVFTAVMLRHPLANAMDTYAHAELWVVLLLVGLAVSLFFWFASSSSLLAGVRHFFFFSFRCFLFILVVPLPLFP